MQVLQKRAQKLLKTRRRQVASNIFLWYIFTPKVQLLVFTLEINKLLIFVFQFPIFIPYFNISHNVWPGLSVPAFQLELIYISHKNQINLIEFKLTATSQIDMDPQIHLETLVGTELLSADPRLLSDLSPDNSELSTVGRVLKVCCHNRR